MTEVLRRSTVWNEATIDDIHAKAELGRYRIRGFSQLRERPLPSFDDLTFLLCTLTRIPLEGYREKCNTQTVLGTRFATRPIINDIPVMISGIALVLCPIMPKWRWRVAPRRLAVPPPLVMVACSPPSATTPGR